MDVDTCVMCGDIVPEGMHVCPICKSRFEREEPDLYRDSIQILKGDVFYADLDPVIGSEVGGRRPVVIIQNDIGNKFGPTVVAAITSRPKKKQYPMHVPVKAPLGGLTSDSVIMLEQIRTIDKQRLGQFLGHVDDDTIQLIENAEKITLGIN